MATLSGVYGMGTDSGVRTGNRKSSGRQSGQDNGTQPLSRLARGLGWFSIGLGVTELIAPGAIGRVVGARNSRSLIRAYGLREIAAGVGILSAARPSKWLWSRVAGDVIDLASIGGVARGRRKQRSQAALGAAAVAGVAALDVLCARRMSSSTSAKAQQRESTAETSLMINRSPEECYAFWRDFEKLPRFMNYLESVRLTGDRTSHWIAKLPGNVRCEWDAELVNDTPNRRIEWRTLPGTPLPQAGSVEFHRANGDRGTVVHVTMEYGTPATSIASKLATLIGKNPEQLIRKELRRFKQVMETGEVITTEGQPAGRRGSVTWLDQIAR